MQNVDINKEVQRAMMSPPQQPRGIIDLLASELKAQDAQAKNKIRAMMAGSPPQDTVLAQNEKTAEDSVRQEIAQKMQAMAVKERQNQARMNRALQGIAAQSAPNMRMMDGGIVGYQAGGNVQTPPKPTMGAVPPSGVGNDQIKQYAEEYMGIKKALENPENAQYKERNQMLLQDLIRQMGDQMPAVMQYIDSMKGIVEPRGFQEGGGIFGPMGIFGPSARRVGTFAEFLASKGIETLSDVSEAVGRQLMQEFIEQKSAGDRRTELAEMAGAPGSEGARQAQPEIPERPYIPTGRPSVASSQMENLAGVARGGANLLREGARGLPSPSALFEGIAGLAPRGKSDVQRELEAAERRMQREQGTDSLGIASRALDPRIGRYRQEAGAQTEMGGMSDFLRGMGNENFFEDLNDTLNEARRSIFPKTSAYYEVPEGELAPYAERMGATVSDIFGIPKRAFEEAVGIVAPTVEDFSRGFTGEGPTQQTDEERAQEIIETGVTEEQYRAATGPAAPAAPAGRTLTREEIDAASALAREAEAGGPEAARRGASYLAGRGGETAVADLASTVAQDPTPENMNRFESEIQRLMERRESPMRALSSFLTAFSQARGGSMGQNLAIATTAMNAADDALDKQIIELEKLRRADEISERDYQLKKDQVESDRLYRKAMADYYSNIESSRLELQELVNQGRLAEARQRLRTELISAGMGNMNVYQMQARAADKNADASTINDRAMALLQQDITKLINTFITNAGGPQFTEGQTATNAQGEKIVFRNGNWEPM